MSKKPSKDERSTVGEVERLTQILLENLANSYDTEQEYHKTFDRHEKKAIKEQVESLLEGRALVNDTNAIGLIAICLCLPNINLLKYVLKAGGHKFINSSIGEDGAKALHHCAVFKEKTDFIKLLVKYGAEVNATDEYGATALYYAAGEGLEEVTKLLLASKADVNITTKNGKTASDFATREGFSEIAKLLLDSGAKVDDTYKINVIGVDGDEHCIVP